MPLTLIETIIVECHEVRDGRGHKDVMLHALTELGELGTEVGIRSGRIDRAPGADGITGEAIDVILCLVDFIWQIDNLSTDRLLIAAEDPAWARDCGSLVQYLFETGIQRHPLNEVGMRGEYLRLARAMGRLCEIPEQPRPDEVAMARQDVTIAIGRCLQMIVSDITAVDELGLVRLAEPKLRKWRASAISA